MASDTDIKASDVTPLSGRPARFKGGLREVGAGAYAWLQPNGGWGEANAGLIVGDGASIVIDTLWDESLAQTMLEAMSAHVRTAPVRTVLNTHSDGDHWWGNATMPPDAEIITCTPSREAMDAESSPQELARLARMAGLSRRAPGSLGALSTYISEMLSPFDLSAVRLRYPNRTFDERLSLEIGGRQVQLLVLGPAHTPGDTIAYLPDARLVFAADLVFVKAIPVMWHGPSTGWLHALDTLLALDADVYVPGHGDVAGAAELEAMKRFWTWLRDGAAERQAAGDDLVGATEALIRSAGFDEFRDWECPERLLISVAAVNRELAGQPPMRVTPAVRARLFRQVAILQRRLRGD